MNKNHLKSKLAEMINSLEEIISGASGRTRELEELIRWRDELKGLDAKIDSGWEIEWSLVISLMREFIACLYSFGSN